MQNCKSPYFQTLGGISTIQYHWPYSGRVHCSLADIVSKSKTPKEGTEAE